MNECRPGTEHAAQACEQIAPQRHVQRQGRLPQVRKFSSFRFNFASTLPVLLPRPKKEKGTMPGRKVTPVGAIIANFLIQGST